MRTVLTIMIATCALASACDEKPKAAIPTAPVLSSAPTSVVTAAAVVVGENQVAPELASARVVGHAVDQVAAPVVPTGKTSATAATAATAGGKSVGMHATGNNFAVDVSAPGNCKVDGACAMSIKLSALGNFHINDEYPYKWVGEPVDGIEYTGKKTGDFKKESATVGTMTVRFTGSDPNTKIAGVYKFSVCSEDKCQIETQRVELNVPLM